MSTHQVQYMHGGVGSDRRHASSSGLGDLPELGACPGRTSCWRPSCRRTTATWWKADLRWRLEGCGASRFPSPPRGLPAASGFRIGIGDTTSAVKRDNTLRSLNHREIGFNPLSHIVRKNKMKRIGRVFE
ncbi:unnamed protein product [Urochloa humidicola]